MASMKDIITQKNIKGK